MTPQLFLLLIDIYKTFVLLSTGMVYGLDVGREMEKRIIKNENLWGHVYGFVLSSVLLVMQYNYTIKFAPFWHLSCSILSCLQRCLKRMPLQIMPQVISNSVFVLAYPVYPPSPFITSRLCSCVCKKCNKIILWLYNLLSFFEVLKYALLLIL